MTTQATTDAARRAKYPDIPDITYATLEMWRKRMPAHPGGFVTAALSNDLHEAVMRGDNRNRAALLSIVCYMANELPANSWGTPERVYAWLQGAA